MGRGPTQEYYQLMNEFYTEGTLTCLKPETIRKLARTSFPLVLNIEPTNDCNLRCSFCPRETVAAQFGVTYMRMSLYRSLIDQAAEYGKLVMLNLHKDGEPLLHPELPEMVRYAKEKQAFHTIHLNTNGMLLGTQRAKELLQAGIDDMTISIDASRPETFVRYKGLNVLPKLEENIRQFFYWRDELGASTFVRVKIMEFDGIEKAEVEEFSAKWRGIADQVQVTGIHSWSGAIDDVTITDEQSQIRYPCGLLWYALAVNADGQVSICNVDWNRSGTVGDANSMALSDIWNNEKIKAIRRSHLRSCWNHPSVCKDCVVWVSVGDMKKFFVEQEDFL